MKTFKAAPFRVSLFFLHGFDYFKSRSFRSFSTVLIVLRWYSFCKSCSMCELRKAGRLGPILMFFIPKESSVRSMRTAFCSYHARL